MSAYHARGTAFLDTVVGSTTNSHFAFIEIPDTRLSELLSPFNSARVFIRDTFQVQLSNNLPKT